MKKLLLLLPITLIFLLCGCASREIDRGYLVSAIGFSKEKDVINLYIEALSSSDTTDKPSEKVTLTASGTSPQIAFKNLSGTLVKPLYFEQLGAVVFEKEINRQALNFLKDIPDINYGVFLVKTNDIDKLFKAQTPNGLLGYDIIGLLKTNGKTKSSLYAISRESFDAPTINIENGRLHFLAKGN